MTVIANAAISLSSHRRRPAPLGRTIFAACAFVSCLFGGWLGIQAARPFQKAATIRAINDVTERKILVLKQRNQDAKKEIESLDTKQGTILAARKLGWLMPGERHLSIPQN